LNKSKLLLSFTFLLVLAAASTLNASSNPGGGRLYGHVYGFNMDDKLIPLSWAKITACRDGEVIDVAYSMDGFFEMYLPEGFFEVTVECPGYVTETTTVYVSDGSDTPIEFVLEESGNPIPEFPETSLTLVLALLATTALVAAGKKRLLHLKTCK